jgi:hypothetical protein
MIIKKSRIKRTGRYLRGLRPGDKFVCALTNIEDHEKAVHAAGFAARLTVGDSLLPTPNGPVSRYNAEGRQIKLTDQPMELAYHMRLWTRHEWHGPYRQEVSDIVSIPYHRYPRAFDAPPSVELTVRATSQGATVIAAPVLELTEANEGLVLHTINLLLELFGECTILRDNLESLLTGELRRLNWQVLPPGRHPWATLEPHVRPVLSRQAADVAPVIRERIETVNKYGADFVACGQAGFQGYLIFGFENQNLFVLESAYADNATYVFREDWEVLSRLSKAEILTGGLHHRRIIHNLAWERAVSTLLGSRAA